MGWYDNYVAQNEPTLVTLSTALDKSIDSVTNYPIGCTATVVDITVDADTTVCAGPCVVMGVYINTVLSAHAVNLLDGATTKLVIPASSAAGLKIDFPVVNFTTSLIVNKNAAATGSMVVFWRAV